MNFILNATGRKKVSNSVIPKRFYQESIIVNVLLLMLLLTPVQADWTMELMNGTNDRSEVKLNLPLKQSWKVETASTMSQPIIMDGKMYMLSRGLEYIIFGKTELLAYERDMKTGMLGKKHKIGKVDNLKWNRMIGYKGKLYVSTVWLDDRDWENEKLIFNLFCYDLKTEQQKWKFSKRIPFRGGSGEEIGAWLNAVDDKVILTLMEVYKEDDKLYCFNAGTGKVLWSTNKPEGRTIENTYPAIGEGKVFLGTNGHLTAFELATGKVIWDIETQEGNNNYEINGNESMVYKDKILYIPFHRNTGQGKFSAVFAETGKEQWKYEKENNAFFRYIPVVDEKNVYAIDHDGFLYKWNRKTGKLEWTFTIGENKYPIMCFQTPTHIAYTIYENDTNYLVFVNKASGKEDTRYALKPLSTTPGKRRVLDVVVDNNKVYALLENGLVYCFEGAK